MCIRHTSAIGSRPVGPRRPPPGLARAALGTGPYGTHNGSGIVLTRSIYLSDAAEGQASVAAVTSSSSCGKRCRAAEPARGGRVSSSTAQPVRVVAARAAGSCR